MLTRAAAKRGVDLFEPALTFFFREALQRIQDQVRYIASRLLLVRAFLFCRHRGILTSAFG